MKATRYNTRVLLSFICLTTIATCQYDVIPPFFPQSRQYPQQDAAYSGQLTLVKNCLRVGDFLVIWPEGFSVSVEGKKINIKDAEGYQIAQVGDYIEFGGVGTEPTEANKNFPLKADDFVMFHQLPVADNCSYPPYWYAKQIKRIHGNWNQNFELKQVIHMVKRLGTLWNTY